MAAVDPYRHSGARPPDPPVPLAAPPQAIGAARRPAGALVAGAIQVRTDTPPEEEDPDADELSALALKKAPPWLISAVFHMAALILLCLLVVAGQKIGQGLTLDVTVDETYAEDLGDQLKFDSPLGVPNCANASASAMRHS